MTQRFASLLALSLALALSACGVEPKVSTPTAPAPPTSMTAKLIFSNTLQAGFTEQDVYVPVKGSSRVTRISRKLSAHNMDLLMNISVRTAAAPVQHDFSVEPPLGPYEGGKSLRVLTKIWLAALGSGVYSTKDGIAELRTSLDHLMRRGSYSLWCATQDSGSGSTLTERPCDLRDGVENRFQADGYAMLNLDVRFSALPDTTAKRKSMLWLVYHSNGNADPAQVQFGVNAHIHTMAVLPSPESVRPVY